LGTELQDISEVIFKYILGAVVGDSNDPNAIGLSPDK